MIEGSERTSEKKHLHKHICGSALLAFFVFFCGAGAIQAAEPIITLTMAKLEVSDRRFSLTRNRPAINAPAAPETPIPQSSESFKTFTSENFTLPTHLLLARPGHETRNPLVITHRNSHENSRAGLWASASVQAGYGQIFFDQTEKTYYATGPGWQEPGCGYLKIRFRF